MSSPEPFQGAFQMGAERELQMSVPVQRSWFEGIPCMRTALLTGLSTATLMTLHIMRTKSKAPTISCSYVIMRHADTDPVQCATRAFVRSSLQRCCRHIRR
jgi:predicted MarR family transcription regulator